MLQRPHGGLLEANLFQQARTGQLPAPVVSVCNGLLLTWLRLAELELGAELALLREELAEMRRTR